MGIACRVVVFCLVLGALMRSAIKVLGMQDDTYTTYGFDQFYDLPKDSVDVMMLGASGMREFYNVNEAYAHNGIACATLATSNQPFIANRYLIEETEKTQHPRLYVMDIRQLEYNDDPIYLECLRHTTDSMRFSRTRLDLINRAFEINAAINPESTDNKIDYIFSYFLYHSRWDELTARDFGNYGDVSWMGFSIFTGVDVREERPELMSQHGTRPATDAHVEELNEVLAYCKELHESQGTEFLFLDSIAWGENRHYERGNVIKGIIEDAGFTFIDTREWFDEMGFDLTTDFRDEAHVNVWGSFKYTDYLADYLMDTYDLADHRGESEYTVWQENYEGFKAAYNQMMEERAAAEEE